MLERANAKRCTMVMFHLHISDLPPFSLCFFFHGAVNLPPVLPPSPPLQVSQTSAFVVHRNQQKKITEITVINGVWGLMVRLEDEWGIGVRCGRRGA